MGMNINDFCIAIENTIFSASVKSAYRANARDKMNGIQKGTLGAKIKQSITNDKHLSSFKKELKSASESTSTNEIIKSAKSYYIKNDNGDVISKVDYYDYSKKGFDWILIANVETKPEYRGNGFATKLVNEVCTDLLYKYLTKGLYLLVRVNNTNAIALYKKIRFKILKEYKMKDGLYYIMYKGNADKQQLVNMNFR